MFYILHTHTGLCLWYIYIQIIKGCESRCNETNGKYCTIFKQEYDDQKLYKILCGVEGRYVRWHGPYMPICQPCTYIYTSPESKCHNIIIRSYISHAQQDRGNNNISHHNIRYLSISYTVDKM
jgi:hypothetical protein